MTNVDLGNPGRDFSNWLAPLLPADLGIDIDALQFSLLDDALVLSGAVNSYHQKVMVERAVRSAGFQRVENMLRVVPGLTP